MEFIENYGVIIGAVIFIGLVILGIRWIIMSAVRGAIRAEKKRGG
jgi:hypothetical protein